MDTTEHSPRRLWPRLRRVWSLAWPYRGSLAGAATLLLLAAAANLLLPLGIKRLLDQALNGSGQRHLDLFALVLLALFLVRAVLAFAGQLLMRITGERITASLRGELYRHLHKLDLKFHGEQKIGDLSSRLSNDAEAIRSAATDATVSIALNAFQLLGSVAVMVTLDWRLSLIVLLIAPLASVVSKLFGPVLERLARLCQERLAQCTAVAQEALMAVPMVQAFARSGYEARRYENALEELGGTVRQSARVNALFNALISLLFSLSTVLLFWFGGREVLSGRLTAGDLVAFLFYAQNISQCVSVLAGHFASLSAAAGASGRVYELLDTPPRIADAPDAVPVRELKGDLRFDHVSFCHRSGRPVLQDVSFRVEPGETVAIVGPSGAGKTTLLHLIPRFFDPTAGRVLFDGRDVRTIQLQSLREQIAIVSQDVYAFGSSVRDNIRYGRLDASDEEIEAVARAAYAHEFIIALPDGYETRIGERGVRLSGGQRQRLSIARALLKDARILILDEATSSVDLSSEAMIQETLEHLRKGRTTIRVTHRLSQMRDVDRILVMSGGRIIEAGTEKELLALGGLYHQLITGQLPVQSAGKEDWLPLKRANP